jgi:hypothetical protein
VADDLVTEMFDAEPEIREWQERIRSFGVATPGSPLARDDETWEPSAPLATALAKLGSSAEHLLAALAVVQQQHPLAPYTAANRIPVGQPRRVDPCTARRRGQTGTSSIRGAAVQCELPDVPCGGQQG